MCRLLVDRFIRCSYFCSFEDIADAGVYCVFDKSKQSLRQSSSEPATYYKM